MVTRTSVLIENIPRYFQLHVNDCFSNALGACLGFFHLDPELILTDYLNLMVDPDTGLMGNNYILKPQIKEKFGEKELNTSYPLCWFIQPGLSPGEIESKINKDKINIIMITEADGRAAHEKVIQHLNQGIPVHVGVDLYYMPYHPYYQKDHILHYVVLYGYNDMENVMYLFDTHKLSGSNFDGKVDADLVFRGRNSPNPLSNPIQGEFNRPINNIQTEIQVGADFTVDDKVFIHLVEESYKRLTGQKTVLGYSCGTRCIDLIIPYLQKQNRLTPENVFLFGKYYVDTFKSLSRSRHRFLLWLSRYFHSQEYLVGLLRHSKYHWDVSANISYKLSLTRRLSLVEEICNELTQIKIFENKVVKGLERFVVNPGTFFRESEEL